jgi:hypothetical protein
MAQIPKLYENPFIQPEAEESIDDQPNYARRRRVAGAIVGLAIAPILVKAFVDSNHYGYHGHSSGTITQPK